jgi:hypothetical protein
LRDGASTTVTDHDQFDCEREAARMYPPSITTVQQVAGRSSENTKCTKKGDTVDCQTTTTPSLAFAPQVSDANEGRRSQAQGSCMRGKGYYWQEDR